MADAISTAISVRALAVLLTTAWLTLIRRGTVKMTRPTQIFRRGQFTLEKCRGATHL